MSRKVAIIVAVVAILVIVGIVAGILLRGSGSPGSVTATEPQESNTVQAGPSPTHAPIAPNITVPDKGSANVPQNVAAPQVQAEASPSSNASYRSFAITVQNGAFAPNTVIMHAGDDADIEITAVGADYDFTQPDYGFHVKLPEGQTTKIDFAATSPGKFTFYCSSCGGPDKGPVGYIEVVPTP